MLQPISSAPTRRDFMKTLALAGPGGVRVSEQQREEKIRLIEPKLKAVNQFGVEFSHFSPSALPNQPFATHGERGLPGLRLVTALDESWRTGRQAHRAGMNRHAFPTLCEPSS